MQPSAHMPDAQSNQIILHVSAYSKRHMSRTRLASPSMFMVPIALVFMVLIGLYCSGRGAHSFTTGALLMTGSGLPDSAVVTQDKQGGKSGLPLHGMAPSRRG